MTGTPRALALAAILAGTAAGIARAGEPSQAEKYFDARDSAHVIAAPFDGVRLHPQQYRPYLIEIRGTVTGNASREDGATVIVSAPGGTYVLEAARGVAPQAIEAGQTVRVLASIPDGVAVSRLSMVAVVSEYDAASFEAQRVRKATRVAAAPPKKRPIRARHPRRRLASRGAVAARMTGILEQYAQAVLYFNHRLSPDTAMRIAQSILYYSQRYSLDARLVMAVIAVESSFHADAVSSKGAMGLGQLMPGTAAGLGVTDPWSPEQNIEGATRLLSGHVYRLATTQPTEKAIKLALACYNAGAGAVRKYNGVPPYRETKSYVKKVTRLYYQMCGQPVPPSASGD